MRQLWITVWFLEWFHFYKEKIKHRNADNHPKNDEDEENDYESGWIPIS